MKKLILAILVACFLGAILLSATGSAQATAPAPGSTVIKTEFGDFSNFADYMQGVMVWVTGVIEAAAVLMMVYAGFLYMTSQGNSENISQAKDIIIGVVVGVLLLFLIQVILVETVGLRFTFI